LWHDALHDKPQTVMTCSLPTAPVNPVRWFVAKETSLPKVPDQVWNMFPGAGPAFVGRPREKAGPSRPSGAVAINLTGVPMACERAVPHSFRDRLCRLVIGAAIMFGALVTAQAQTGPEAAPPSAAASQAGVPATAPPAEAPPAEAPPAVPAPVAQMPAETASAELLPRDLTPLGMFRSADIIVKAVMLGLVFASVLTWTIWLAKSLELIFARRRLRRADALLAAAPSLDGAVRQASAASPDVALLTGAALNELQRSPDLRDVTGIKERIAARFSRIEAAVGRRMMRATGIVATIGATAPFVGLFGTVWGIMNSFIGISKLHTTNLAVVAPGIAEALLATACGLAAAIPAVVIYNGFVRSITHYRGLFADASVEVLALVGRDLTRPVPASEDKRAEEKRMRALAPGGAAR
jgi:biopolymer transport protein ExbB